MSSHGFRERILEILTSGAALTASTTRTSLLHSSHKTAGLAIGYFDRLPRALKFHFSGRITTVTTPGTLKLELLLGSPAILDSLLMTLNATAQTNVHFDFWGELVAQAIGGGTATTFMPKGCKFQSQAVIGSAGPTAGGAGVHMLPYNAAPAVGAGVDNGTSGVLDLMGTWGTNNANSIQVHAGHIEVIS